MTPDPEYRYGFEDVLFGWTVITSFCPVSVIVPPPLEPSIQIDVLSELSLKLSLSALNTGFGGVLGEAEDEGESEGETELDGERECDGESEAEGLSEGETELDGESEGEAELDGDNEAEGESEADAELSVVLKSSTVTCVDPPESTPAKAII